MNSRSEKLIGNRTAPRLRQSLAEYTAARTDSDPAFAVPGTRMYVCRRCQANFRTGEGKPDARLKGLGKCNRCMASLPAAA